jgi:Putative metallopeptidase
LQQFLAPLKLTRKLVVKFDQCGGATSLRYKHQGPVVICYEYVDQIERLAPRSTVDLAQGPVTRESAIVGPVVQSILHEVAIAAFDILELPVWGRLDDAADRAAAFMMLQFGQDVAWNTVIGSAWFLAGNALSPPDLSDVRGVTAQRYYTTLCIAFGGEQRQAFKSNPNDYRKFWNFVSSGGAGDLPQERAKGCTDEFDTLKRGFDEVVMPHMDRALLEQVQKTSGINFGAGP